jgi:hypothetical protein
VAHLRSWGFNTTGDSSDTSTFGPLIPYTVQLSMASGNDWFAPSFVAHADQVAATQVTSLADDPNLIGYFNESELAWGPNEDKDQSLLDQYLALLPGWPGLAVAQQYPGDPNGFATALATRYFSVTSDALHQYDPHHLNLGVKEESNDIPLELLEVASNYVDISASTTTPSSRATLPPRSRPSRTTCRSSRISPTSRHTLEPDAASVASTGPDAILE